MVRADYARDLIQRPSYVLGAAHETTHREIAQMADLTVSGTAAAQPDRASRRRRTRRATSMVAYDAFTINTILFLEAWVSAREVRQPLRADAIRPVAPFRSAPTAAAVLRASGM
jgi:hypothetical protein